MKYRKLGNTGIEVSEIGFGAWGIGGVTPGATSYGPTDDGESLRALARALDEGITFFDTSPAYGAGHSEELLGRALGSHRDRVVIATKAGLERYGKQLDFSPTGIRRSVEESLARLGTDHIDLLQLHNPPPKVLENGDEIGQLIGSLRQSGMIRAFGISLQSPEDGAGAITHMQPDALQINFNMLDQRPIDCGLLARARDSGTALIARTPLCFGFLTGAFDAGYAFDEHDHRSRWPAAQVERWIAGGQAMRACMTAADDQTDSQAALRFCLSFDEITTVIPGMLTSAEVDDNIQASTLGTLSAAELSEVAGNYRSIDLFGDDKPSDPGRVVAQ